MATIVEMLDELEKVRLTPMVVPVLTMADPVLAAMPKGSLGALFSRRDTRESLVRTVEAFSPVLPDAIKFVGHVAESRLMTGLLSFWAAVLKRTAGLWAPLAARLVIPLARSALGLTGRSSRVLPPIIGGLDRLTRLELALERPFTRGART